MPSITVCNCSRDSPKSRTTGASALPTGCSGEPANVASISCRHQASLVRATAGSDTSSTTSSTSRQNA